MNLVTHTFNWQSGGSKARLGWTAEAANALHVGQTPAVAHTLRGRGYAASEDGTGRGTPLVPVLAPTLAKESHSPTKSSSGQMVDFCIPSGMAVRRLTPRECERLQGFPDDWTRYAASARGDKQRYLPWEEQSDSTRYRQLGNAVAVPCVQWILSRIAEAAQ